MKNLGPGDALMIEFSQWDNLHYRIKTSFGKQEIIKPFEKTQRALAKYRVDHSSISDVVRE
jgi:hypothetical protein